MNTRLKHQAHTYVSKVIEDSGTVASATMGEQTGTLYARRIPSDWIAYLL